MNTTQTKLGPISYGIIVLTLFTAFVHLVLLSIGMGKIDPVFVLNGLGYLAILAAYFLPQFKGLHSTVRWAFMGYAFLNIIAWIILGDKTWPEGALGYFTKLDEVLLIILLWLDGRK